MVHQLTIFTLTFGLAVASQWSYNNQSAWSGICKTGLSQSPINIETSSTKQTYFLPFQFSDYSQRIYANVTNNGHTVRIVLLGNNTVPTVQKGGLPGVYALDSVHFHWFSEHTINNYRFPAELHAVHYDTKYGDLDSALEHEHGVAVFSVLFEISSDDDVYFNPIMKVIEEVDNTVGMTAQTEESFSPDIFFPRDTSGFYRYMGSLTTPDCNEGVIWTIFTNFLHISQSQVSHFTSMWSETGLLNENFRTIQNLNRREILEKVSPLPSRINKLPSSSARSRNDMPILFVMLTIYLFL